MNQKKGLVSVAYIYSNDNILRASFHFLFTGTQRGDEGLGAASGPLHHGSGTCWYLLDSMMHRIGCFCGFDGIRLNVLRAPHLWG